MSSVWLQTVAATCHSSPLLINVVAAWSGRRVWHRRVARDVSNTIATSRFRLQSIMSRYDFSTDMYIEMTSKLGLYRRVQCPHQSYLWCTSWTVLAADAKRLEAFDMKCQRQIMKIRWQDHIRNTEVASLTGLCLVLDLITRRRNVVFGHIARLSEDTPASSPSTPVSRRLISRTPS